MIKFATAVSLYATLLASASNAKKRATPDYPRILREKVTVDEITGVETVALDLLNSFEETMITTRGFYLEAGQSVVFSVRENPTSGFTWQLDTSVINEAFTVTEEMVQDEFPGLDQAFIDQMVGVSGVRYYTVVAADEAAVGEFSISLEREWEDLPSEREFKFPVKVIEPTI